MEYIHGLDIRTFLEHADHEMIDAFVDELCDILDLLSDRKYDMIDSSVFENKIRTITSGDPYIEKWLLERDWHAFPDTESHGDMTFENMIVGGDGIVFIDFLDGISSYQLDYAKILQDARCYWFMRDRPSKNIAIKCDYIAQQLKEEYDTGRDDQLVVFHLYRILPYCRREKDTKFVIEAIDRIIQ
ncbi:MAG: hypothetical protein HN684_05070 [Euryarchaeota archaeon]|nr:hypothetical protein [Euryarchaeota archaeon]